VYNNFRILQNKMLAADAGLDKTTTPWSSEKLLPNASEMQEQTPPAVVVQGRWSWMDCRWRMGGGYVLGRMEVRGSQFHSSGSGVLRINPETDVCSKIVGIELLCLENSRKQLFNNA